MDEKTLKNIKSQVSALPQLPGCYMFRNGEGTIIYVGKAKRLKNRVSSYFVNNRDHTPKVRIMVRQIASLEYRIVDSETDALLLENSLIKLHKPKYNILLKDDKTYPWIVLRKEPFPRILSTRQITRDGSEYYGPYGSVLAQKAVLEFIREIIPLRTCKFDLEEKKIKAGKYSKCLRYHIHACMAPCIGLQSEEEYDRYVSIARSILKGDLRPVKLYLEKEMAEAARNLKFELAQGYKSRLEALEKYRSKSVIVSASIGDVDVFTLLEDTDEAFCNFIRVRNGAVTAIQTIPINMGIEADRRQMLSMAIEHVVDSFAGALSKTVLVPFLPFEELFEGVKFVVPQRGEKHSLIEFSERSARLFRAEQLKNLELRNPERHTERLMEAMRKELRLENAPRHIECFDNSNLEGTDPVAACVVFRDGRPSKKEYRHFNVKTVEGPDDYASMREIVGRRYRRVLEEGSALPDLIVVDGGKGQLSSAYEVLCELGIEKRVPIVALAERLEEVYYPFDPNPYYLSRTGEPLKVMCHIRDEAHRFGITFHRNKRSRSFIHSELDNIAGIGEKTKALLLKHFRSVAQVKNADPEKIAEVIGRSKAEKLRNALEDK